MDTADEDHIYAANYTDELWLTEVDLHEHMGAPGEEPLAPMPGVELPWAGQMRRA